MFSTKFLCVRDVIRRKEEDNVCSVDKNYRAKEDEVIEETDEADRNFVQVHCL